MNANLKGDSRLFDNLAGKQFDHLAGYSLIAGESREELSRMIKAVYDQNMRTMVIENRYHPEYCEQGYFDDMRFMFEECRKLGMRVWLMDDCQCPSGSCNFLPSKPEYTYLRPWEIREIHIDAAGPVKDCCIAVTNWIQNESDNPLAVENTLQDENESILAVVAVKHIPNSELLSDEYVNIPVDLHDGLLYFDLGEGVWRIFILIKTRAHTEPFVDKLRPECTEFYISQVHQKIYDNLSEYFGNTFLGFFNDEAGFHNNAHKQYITPMGVAEAQYPWGDCVLEGFKEIYADEAFVKLIGLWHNFADHSEEKARVDFMEIITKAFYENFSKKIADFCHSHGVQLIGHFLEDKNAHAKTGHGCGHFFRAVGDQDMSGIDTVLQQHIPGLAECSHKASTSMGHHDNVFYHYYLAKLGASYAHIDSRKKGRLMCEIFGAFGNVEGTKMMKYVADHMLVRGVNYPLPCGFTTDFNKEKHFPPHLYCGNMFHPLLSHFADIMDYMNRICNLLTDGIHTSSCAIFYDAHGIWTNTDFVEGQAVAKVLYDNLYDYDILPIEYIEKIDKDGMLNGEKYNLLLLPYSSYLPEEIVASLKNSNIEVICVSDKEQKSPYFPTIDLTQIPALMEEKNLGDVKADYDGIYLRPYHYTRGGTHFYMFVNEDMNNAISTDITLGVFSGGDYVIYNPLENKAWHGTSADGKVHIDLPIYSSVFVICGDFDYEALPDLPSYTLIDDTEIKATYEISTSEDGESFTHYTTTAELFNMTNYNHKQHFSGKTRYETKVNLKKADKVILDLGYVGEAAQLTVNGKDAGKKFAPPYTFDITDIVKDGENTIDILVSNSLVHKVFDIRSKFLSIEPSGLMGPVKVQTYSEN